VITVAAIPMLALLGSCWGSAGCRIAPPAAAPAVARTAKECKACRGEWGVHGLAEEASCNCRTTDGGKRCRDGAECQGQCIAAATPERQVTAAGPPARGYFVGRCSELVTVFGCHRFIERGTLARGPVPLDDSLLYEICVD
jgi:hypothetical protein